MGDLKRRISDLEQAAGSNAPTIIPLYLGESQDEAARQYLAHRGLKELPSALTIYVTGYITREKARALGREF